MLKNFKLYRIFKINFHVSVFIYIYIYCIYKNPKENFPKAREIFM